MESIYALILINVLVFLGLATRSPDVQNQIIQNTLGLTPSMVWSHPWQLITSMFTHQEVLHIVFNMWALYFFGTAVLRRLGAARFWTIYMVGGIVGGLVYVLLGVRDSTAIGASGAIFALGGALAVLEPNMRVIFFPVPIPMPLWIGILLSFAIISFVPGVAWQAHLGGLAFGAAFGWYYRRHSFDAYRWH